MKKYFAIFCLFCYLLSTAGLAVSLHFCMGNLEKVAFFKGNDSCACQEKNNCCKDLVKYFKYYEAHKNVNSTNANDVLVHDFVCNNFFNSNNIANAQWYNMSMEANAPPGNSSPIFLENCSFRI